MADFTWSLHSKEILNSESGVALLSIKQSARSIVQRLIPFAAAGSPWLYDERHGCHDSWCWEHMRWFDNAEESDSPLRILQVDGMEC